MRLYVAAAALAAVLLANPKRGSQWTCPTCKTKQDEDRANCMNGCGTAGPLATDRAKQEAEQRQGGDA